MVNPISSEHLTPSGPSEISTLKSRTASTERAGKPPSDTGFAAQLREQLEQVSQMQTEADAGIQNLLTGRTDNITEVLTAARKADVAFGLLMEIRNKLVDAYTELRQLRV
jgi:flagellar hook-basal body complex protein FliE